MSITVATKAGREGDSLLSCTNVDGQYINMEVRTKILWGCTSFAENNIGYSSYWPAVFQSAAVITCLLKGDASIDSEWEA